MSAPDPVAHLRAELRAYVAEHPDQQRFIHALLDAISRIEAQFEGEMRDRLLEQTRRTFDRHVEITRETRRTRAALERLEAAQQRLIETFGQLTTVRPPDTTLH